MKTHQINELIVSYNPVIQCDNKITSSQDVYNIAREIWDWNTIHLQEEFKILLLNRNNRVIGIYSLSKGGITQTVVDIRLIYAIALKTAACSIILLHNHPSGNLKPSDQDKIITEKIVRSGELLDIKVLDHLIISAESYFSFADEGLL